MSLSGIGTIGVGLKNMIPWAMTGAGIAGGFLGMQSMFAGPIYAKTWYDTAQGMEQGELDARLKWYTDRGYDDPFVKTDSGTDVYWDQLQKHETWKKEVLNVPEPMTELDYLFQLQEMENTKMKLRNTVLGMSIGVRNRQPFFEMKI